MAASFLSTLPRGGFTCARANKNGKVLSKSLHVERLLNSLIHFNGGTALLQDTVEKAKEKIEIELNQYLDPDRMLMLFVSMVDEGKDLHIEKKEFPLVKARIVLDRVVIGGGRPRSFSFVKDSFWITERKPYEILKEQLQASEFILSNFDDKGNILLYEGLITNFFVVDNKNRIFTAPNETVLPGSMREIVINLCIQKNIKVVFEPPKWNDKVNWILAFVTSVTKPCCFIHTLINIADETDQISFNLNHPFRLEFEILIDNWLEIDE